MNKSNSKNNSSTGIDFQKFKTKEYLESTKNFLEKKYGLKFIKKGKDYFTYCPFHKENRRSFVLYCKSYKGWKILWRYNGNSEKEIKSSLISHNKITITRN